MMCVKIQIQRSGICFSNEAFGIVNKIKKFNYKNIYLSEKTKSSNKFFELVINEIYNTLKKTYDEDNTLKNIEKMKRFYPELAINFKEWLSNYWNLPREQWSKNDEIFNIKDEKDYCKAIIYYISGMTDNYAIDVYNKIIGF